MRDIFLLQFGSEEPEECSELRHIDQTDRLKIRLSFRVVAAVCYRGLTWSSTAINRTSLAINLVGVNA